MKKADPTYLALYWLKRVVVVGSLPLLTATLAFYIFKALPGSFASEAQIKIFFSGNAGETEDERDLFLKNKIQPLLISMRSERSMELLSLSLLEREFKAPVIFSDPVIWEKLGLMEHKDSLILLCQRKRENLELGFSEQAKDSSLYNVLEKLRFDPASLQKRISIRRIPGTNTIGIQARTFKSALSTYMVDQYCLEFIRYYQIVEKERLEGSLEVLDQLMTQRKAELNENRLNLEKVQNQLERSNGQREILNILSRIGELEMNKKEQKQRVKSLKAALTRFRKGKEKKTVVKAAHFSSNEPTQKEGSYLVKEEDEAKLLIELGTVLANIEFLNQEIETLKGKLALKEEEILVPYREDLEDARVSYLNVLENIKETEAEYQKVDKTLKQVRWGKSRMKMPQSHKLMAILTGLASFFVWLIFLINIGFITIEPKVSESIDGANKPIIKRL